MVTLVCLACGEEFETYPSVARHGQRYCSYTCSRTAMAAFRGERSWHWKGGHPTQRCEHCERTFIGRRARRSRFCSRKCYHEQRVGAAVWSWKGGVSKQPGYRALTGQIRRARIASALGSGVSRAEWESILDRFHRRCAWCKEGESLFVRLAMDHIVPLSKGGAHRADNIQPLCGRCNSKKGTRTIAFDPDSDIGIEVTDMKAFFAAVVNGDVPLEAVRMGGAA